jgi:rhomboid protease GluP
MMCPNCRRLVTTDERVCPYCGIRNPGSWWRSLWGARGLLNPGQVLRLLIYVNATFFVISILMNPLRLNLSANPFTLLSPSDRILFLLGATGTIPIGEFKRWWTLISANYLHGGILHIFFNMAALRYVGTLVVREFGVYRMMTIYTLGGIAGFWLSYFVGVGFTIGASAAVCSLIGAALYYGKSRGGAYGQAVYRQTGGWVVGLFLFGFMVPGINNWAHGGGLCMGIIVGLLLGYEEKSPENVFNRILGSGFIVTTIAVLLWALGSGLYYRFLA